MMNNESLSCFQADQLSISKLPFGDTNWVLGYYDGPLEGFAKCNVCLQMFYYNCVEMDDFYLGEKRIYNFTNLTPVAEYSDATARRDGGPPSRIKIRR